MGDDQQFSIGSKLVSRLPHLPYGRHTILQDDIDAVIRVLNSDWLTTGPEIENFERSLTEFTGANFAVAVSSGTAALHTAMNALNIGPGDEVLVPSQTFAATANAVVYQGATPIFVDVLSDSLLMDPSDIIKKISKKTKAIIAVDYGGHPCDYQSIRDICSEYALFLVADAAHSIGAQYRGENVGKLADLTTFSFHPVKHITTGEGGAILTDNEEWAKKMRCFRNHGITTDHRERTEKNLWFYEMVDLGFNYRITDLQCALGQSQIKHLPQWLEKRNILAQKYREILKDNSNIDFLSVSDIVYHAYHLFVIKIPSKIRNQVFSLMRSNNIGVNVHYIPVHLHPYYQNKFKTYAGMCPEAERVYSQILSLPLYPDLSIDEIERVSNTLVQSINLLTK